MDKKRNLTNQPFNAPFLRVRKELESILATAKVYEATAIESSSDDQVFISAMQDVVPLDPCGFHASFIDARPRKSSTCPCPESVEAMKGLYQLVDGTEPFDPAYSDEYLQWCVAGLNPKIFENLRKGLFPIQSVVDLHRYTAQESKRIVQDFVWKSYLQGLTCILIVHGKGLNSRNRVPVLKRHVGSWLRAGIASKIVLAFATARNCDGGLGAMYILIEPSRKYVSAAHIHQYARKKKRKSNGTVKSLFLDLEKSR